MSFAPRSEGPHPDRYHQPAGAHERAPSAGEFGTRRGIQRLDADPNLWVAIITGAGDRAFSAGNDLRYQAEGAARPHAPGLRGLTSRFNMSKPVIAAVNGVAMGGGFEIALACDIILASKTARFALPEPKVGLAALAGGLHRLPRQIGTKAAMGMILTGRHVPAEEGLQLGFVNEVTEPEALMDRARAGPP